MSNQNEADDFETSYGRTCASRARQPIQEKADVG
jgi:hypothetical protein